MSDEEKTDIEVIRDIERTISEIERIFHDFDEQEKAREKINPMAKIMHLMLGGGFGAMLVNFFTAQSIAIGIAGAFLMAVPIVWVTWKEGP